MAPGRIRFTALVLCACICGVSIVAEDLPDGPPDRAAYIQEASMLGKEESKEDKVVKRAIGNTVTSVNDLSTEAHELKKKKTKERRKKANDSVRFMEKFKAKKVDFSREKARLRNRIDKDKMEIFRTTPGVREAYERNKKHDSNVKANMKKALQAMGKVDDLVRGNIKPDATIRMAKKAAIKARGSEIYTVLGLDTEQLGKDYLLDLDAAVAAYDAKPSPGSQEKLSKALKRSREKMEKDRLKERQAKSEKVEKKKRDKQNKKYYDTKWREKKREMAKKKVMRDKFVAKLKKEKKHKAWVKRKNEDEADVKSRKYGIEKRGKISKVNKKKELAKKRLFAKAKIKQNKKNKIKAAYQKLVDISKAKRADYKRKVLDRKRAKEATTKGKQAMERTQKNMSAADKLKREAAQKLGVAKEKKGKAGSEANVKSETTAQKFVDGKTLRANEASFKVKQSMTKRKEADGKLAKAKTAEKLALTTSITAKRKASLYMVSLKAKKKVKKPTARKVMTPKTRRRRL